MEPYKKLTESVFNSNEPVTLHLLSYDKDEKENTFKEVAVGSKETLLLIVKTLLDNHIDFYVGTEEYLFYNDFNGLNWMKY